MKSSNTKGGTINQKRKRLSSSVSMDKSQDGKTQTRTTESTYYINNKHKKQRNTSMPKLVPKPKPSIAKKPPVSYIEMETARLFIELLKPLIIQRNGFYNVPVTNDLSKNNKRTSKEAIIYKRNCVVFKSNDDIRLNEKLPVKIKLFPTANSVHFIKNTSIASKLEQITALKNKECLKYIFFNKIRDDGFFIRINKAFDEDLIGIFHNYISLYLDYSGNQKQKESDSLNTTLLINKPDRNKSIVQGSQLKPNKNGNMNGKSSIVNVKKVYDVGLTPFPAKKCKSKRDDYEYTVASRAANLIRRIEYSNYIKYYQPKSKEDFLNILNIKATILQKWWRRMLTSNTFYYKVITIQRIYKGYITRKAFDSASRLTKQIIPFFSKLIFIFNKAKFEHLYNKLLYLTAYLYQYTITYKNLSIITRSFARYIRRNNAIYDEMCLNKASLNYLYLKQYFWNLAGYNSLILKVKFLQRNILDFLNKKRPKINSLMSTRNNFPNQSCLGIITEIQKYALNGFFSQLNQYNISNNPETINNLMNQRNVLAKIINKRHMKNCFFKLERQLHRFRLRCYLSMNLMRVSLKYITFLPIIRLLTSHSLKEDANHIIIKEDISEKETQSKLANYHIKQDPSPKTKLMYNKLRSLIEKASLRQLKAVFDLYIQMVGIKLPNTQTAKAYHFSKKSTFEPLFTTSNKYAIYCSLRKIVNVLIRKNEITFRFYFTKFIINTKKRAPLTSLKQSDSKFPFCINQDSNQAIRPINTRRRAYIHKVICFVIKTNIHCTILRRLLAIFEKNTSYSKESSPNQYRSKLVNISLKRILKIRYASKKSILSKYFTCYHSIVYLAKVNELYLQSINNSGTEPNKSGEINHGLSINILFDNSPHKKDLLNMRLKDIFDSLQKYYNNFLLLSLLKWKRKSTQKKINKKVRVIQRNWRLKLLPKQRLALLFLRFFNIKCLNK